MLNGAGNNLTVKINSAAAAGVGVACADVNPKAKDALSSNANGLIWH